MDYPAATLGRWRTVPGAVRRHLFDVHTYALTEPKVTACGLEVRAENPGTPYEGDPVIDHELCPECRRAAEWSERR